MPFLEIPRKFLTIFFIITSYLISGFSFAEIVTFQITAKISTVDDLDNTLGGQINAGDTITGKYTYDTSINDSNSASTVGDYRHASPPAGIELNINNIIFKTNPNNVDFLVEIVNDHGTPASDNYLLRSYNNIAIPSTIPVDHISWQLDDASLQAIDSIVLTDQPPVLADWNSVSGLTITGERCTNQPCSPNPPYFIRAHVESIIDEEPPEISFIFTPAERVNLIWTSKK